jgi:hypothetical protein
VTHPLQITDPAAAIRFVMGGNARFTLVSKKTGKRYTYRASAPRGETPETSSMRFVGVLTSHDNTDGYTYLGFIKGDFPGWLSAGKKGATDAAPFKALHWALNALAHGRMPETLEFWHEGRCARCARVLTDPVSIERGLGPERAGKV